MLLMELKLLYSDTRSPRTLAFRPSLKESNAQASYYQYIPTSIAGIILMLRYKQETSLLGYNTY